MIRPLRHFDDLVFRRSLHVNLATSSTLPLGEVYCLPDALRGIRVTLVLEGMHLIVVLLSVLSGVSSANPSTCW